VSRLHWERSGRGPTVVLVHGVGLTGRFWTDAVSLLDRSFSCVVVDLDGFGRSAPHPGHRDVAGYAESLMSTIGELGDERVAVVGHSLGGMVAQELAVAAPDHVSALVLCNTLSKAGPRVREINEVLAKCALDAGSAALAARMEEGLFGVPSMEGSGPARQRFFSDFGDADPAAVAAALLAIRDFDVIDRIGTLRVPVLVVAGECEANLQDQIAAAAAFPEAEVAVIKGAGHMAPAEAPSELARLVRSFLLQTRPITSPTPDPAPLVRH